MTSAGTGGSGNSNDLEGIIRQARAWVENGHIRCCSSVCTPESCARYNSCKVYLCTLTRRGGDNK